MSLRSSRADQLDRALRALDVQAAGGVLLLGPQQVVGLLADLRAGGPRAGARHRVADAHRRRPGRARWPGSASAAGAAARAWTTVRRWRPAGRGRGGRSWCVSLAVSSRAGVDRAGARFWAARAPRCFAAPCTRACRSVHAGSGLSRGPWSRACIGAEPAMPLSSCSRHAARPGAPMPHARQRDEHRPGRRRAERAGFWARLDRPPVPRPEVRPVRRHRLRRPHGARCTPATSC